MERSRREPERLTAVLFLDLDRFKIVNDSLGHLVGRRAADPDRRARSPRRCAASDTVARVGGDEFAILLEGGRDVGDAVRVAERIHERLTAPFNLGGHEVFATASIGIAVRTPEYERPEDLLRDADTAMYRAKASGRACHVVFNRGDAPLRSWRGCSWRPTCGGRSSAASSGSTTSRSWTSRPAR